MADNRQNLLNEISDGLKGIRAAINSSNVTIPEDTPLQDYEKYIREISKTHVDIGKQIFVFYTWAKTVDEALGYDKPSIHWNNETGAGWTVQETNDWQLDIPDNSNDSGSEPDDTYYTFVMFVSLSIGNSTGDGFVWPTPVQISGSKGEQGEKGDQGKDGIVAGLILNTNINLYSLSPDIEESNLTYDIETYENSSSYELLGTYLKYNNKPITVWSNDSQDSLFLTCPETNEPVYTLTVKVSSGTSKVKIIYGPTCQSISDVTIEYSNDNDEWGNEASLSKENPNLYAKVKTKLGTWEYESEPKLIAKYPNEIENFSIIAYGTSWSTTEEPTKWQDTMPDMNEECPPVLWGKYRVEHLDSNKTVEINTPILHRGTAGIPYNLIMVFEDELDIDDESNNPLLWIRENWEKLSVINNAVKAGNVVYMYVGSNVNENSSSYVCIGTNQYLLKLGTFGGTGTGTQMVEITHDDLKKLRSRSKLIPGMQYRITDYTTTTIQANTQSAGHQFDIIVTADDVNALNENARAIQHTNDENDYFHNSNLDAWELKYRLDNDTNRFAWADTTNGKGVIYYMKDEWNNECPYDFKNIQFAHESESPTYCYTFGKDADYSIDGRNYGNVIKEYKKGSEMLLNNIVFLTFDCFHNSFGNDCSYNSFGGSCSSNNFGNDCSYNSFGNDCSYNSFGGSCSFNDFSNKCSYNDFSNNCSHNDFGSNCSHNSFGNFCSSNDFGVSCCYNSFGGSCSSNDFGRGCFHNSFGNNCSDNSFGDYCSYNDFSNNCSYNNFGESKNNLKSYYRYIIFDNGNSYINLNCMAETSNSKYYQNVRIGLGVNNTTTYTKINDPNAGQTYETLYRPPLSQTI